MERISNISPKSETIPNMTARTAGNMAAEEEDADTAVNAAPAANPTGTQRSSIQGRKDN